MNFATAVIVGMAAITPAASKIVPAPCTGAAHQFVIEVTSTGPAQAALKGAVGFARQVELVEQQTPYRLELSAPSLVAMFSSPASAELRAALYVRSGDELEMVGDVTTRGPALILESASCPEIGRQFSGI